ncbi:MAG: DUF1611 domain-containing protein [Gammaproteobacteria bacterium]|nr:DUF1611 domain-containing protein [Gammaproteobacteria bacterium]MDE0443645.1 DUF1611 domain-containing protein [Gammaproteobacteria bacterium]
MDLETPYLVFVGDAKDALAAKTGQGVVDWRPEAVVGQLRLPECRADLGVADMSIRQAVAAGARTLLIGVVNPGGVLPKHWQGLIVEALEAGLHVASGLHTALEGVPAIDEAARRSNRQLVEARRPVGPFPVASGRKRTGKRLLTVGTDCSVGKKYAALAIVRELVARNVAADFRATGQTGILIAGSGIPIDAVVADFAAGAVEALSPDNDPGHWDVVEGQGSLFHPSFAGVSLALLHGSQPDAVVVCHEPTRTTMRNVDVPIADIDAVIEQTIALGRLTNPAVRCVGIALNTSELDAASASHTIEQAHRRFGVPVCDPVRHGVEAIVDEMLA